MFDIILSSYGNPLPTFPAHPSPAHSALSPCRVLTASCRQDTSYSFSTFGSAGIDSNANALCGTATNFGAASYTGPNGVFKGHTTLQVDGRRPGCMCVVGRAGLGEYPFYVERGGRGTSMLFYAHIPGCMHLLHLQRPCPATNRCRWCRNLRLRRPCSSPSRRTAVAASPTSRSPSTRHKGPAALSACPACRPSGTATGTCLRSQQAADMGAA
jgi:hypothetical protein